MNATDTDQIVMTDKNTTPDTPPSPPTQKTPRAAAELKLPWRGLGVWNVYFILKFALAYFSYLNLDVLWNALLLVFLLIPIPYRWLSALRGLAAVAAGAALAYSESWLPPMAWMRRATSRVPRLIRAPFRLDRPLPSRNPAAMPTTFLAAAPTSLPMRSSP